MSSQEVKAVAKQPSTNRHRTVHACGCEHCTRRGMVELTPCPTPVCVEHGPFPTGWVSAYPMSVRLEGTTVSCGCVVELRYIAPFRSEYRVRRQAEQTSE